MMRIHAELFELSADGKKWLMVEPRLLYICCQKAENGDTIVRAASSTGRNILETVIIKGQKVEKISDCFVFWRDVGDRTLALNTLSAKDTTSFMSFCLDSMPSVVSTNTDYNPLMSNITSMLQHNIMAQVKIIGAWNGQRLERRNGHQETTMVSVNPLSMVFHYNHGLVNVDLVECFFVASVNQPNILHLSYATNIFCFEFSGEAEKFVKQVLCMSSLLLARTTCTDVAMMYLKRQLSKLHDKELLLKYHQGERENKAMKAKLKLKEYAVEQRVAAFEDRPAVSTCPIVSSELFLSLQDQLLPECPLSSIYLIYANMYNFRMWRKPVEVRVNDLKALVSVQPNQQLNDAVMTCVSTSSDVIIPISLPNGKTTCISHINEDPVEILQKLCSRLSLQPEHFELRKPNCPEATWRLVLSEEYEVEKNQGKLGLTIYAHNDGGTIRAEVRGVASYAPGGAAIGDTVISVDGRLIAQVTSAADVEKLLREGRIIRLRRRNSMFQKTRHVLPPTVPLAELRSKMEEKMVRGIDEMLQTERKYVDDINEMIEKFLSIKVVREIMESALRLRDVQVAFLDSLQEAVGDVNVMKSQSRPQIRDAVIRISALFVNKCSDFKIYAEYSAAYLRLQRELSLSKELLLQLETANSSGEQHCSYESRMIRPIQRVVQYPLLLRAILAGCEKDSLESRQVEAALEKMQTLAEYVNEMQRIHEQFAPLIEWIRKEKQSLLNEKGIRIDIRYLVIFAHIRWVNGDKANPDYVIFVFQSLVLLVPANMKGEYKMKYIRLIPINEVEIEEDSQPSKSEECLVVLYHVVAKGTNAQLGQGTTEAVYHLACCQQQVKQHIVKSIRKARTNFIRETRRPLSGSSQSDGGYGSETTKDKKK
ncbi:unnamed protein product [Auanema sp. JU1783]|nr:unnamed protein product [Auanema sp. JU1783]